MTAIEIIDDFLLKKQLFRESIENDYPITIIAEMILKDNLIEIKLLRKIKRELEKHLKEQENE